MALRIGGRKWPTFQLAQNMVGTGMCSPRWSTINTVSRRMRPRKLGPLLKHARKSLRPTRPACNPFPSCPQETLYILHINLSFSGWWCYSSWLNKLTNAAPSNTGRAKVDEKLTSLAARPVRPVHTRSTRQDATGTICMLERDSGGSCGYFQTTLEVLNSISPLAGKYCWPYFDPVVYIQTFVLQI
jgi:hypothetical protein